MREVEFKQSVFELLNVLKDTFHEYCGLLSIEEVMTNHELIQCVEKLERSILSAIQTMEAK